MGQGLHHKILPVFLLVLMGVAANAPTGWAEEERPPVPASATGANEHHGDCRALMAGIEEHNRKLTQELRQIKREIAALNQNLEKPGVREIMAGIGSILGLFGVAAFFAARRQHKGSQGD